MPPALRFGIALVLVAIVGGFDAATGAEMSFSIFYLLPVAFAGGLLARSAGTAVAVLAAGVWGYLEITTGRPYSASWIPYWNTGVRLGFFLTVNELLAVARRAHKNEQALSRIDLVTGIPNARAFEEEALRVIALSRRYRRPFTITYVDLDRFKEVNDELGHAEGDRVLRSFAKLIAHSARATDVVARLGGDEFGIIMPETGLEQARVSLERLAAALATGATGHCSVGATLGAMTFTEPPADVAFAVHLADTLMYQAKAGGRGRILQDTWPQRSAVTRGSASE